MDDLAHIATDSQNWNKCEPSRLHLSRVSQLSRLAAFSKMYKVHKVLYIAHNSTRGVQGRSKKRVEQRKLACIEFVLKYTKCCI